MKIKALLLSVLIVINMIYIPVSADDIVDSSVESYVEFLEMLGISDGIDTGDLTRAVSRAEFASLAVNMTNLSTVVTDADDFSDVDISEGFGPKIYDALYLGLIDESPVNMFYPDDNIAYESAVKMVIEGLGYGKKAALYGGYPSGYIRVANELDILSGVESDMKLSDAITLVRNALLCDVWIVDAVSGENFEYSTAKGRTLLTENFGLNYTSGVVTTAGFRSANYGYAASESRLEISNVMYKTDIKNIDKYLGYNVDAWYDDKGNVKAVLTNYNNSSITVSGEDVTKYANFELVVETDNKEKKYKFDSGYTYILNGRLYDQTNDDFMFENGTLTLIDNSGDGKYDFVIAERYEFFEVTSIEELSHTLYDSSKNKIKFEDDATSHYEFVSYNLKKDKYESSNFDAITVGSLLEIKESGDGQLKHITLLSGNSLSGKIEEVGNDHIVINGSAYKLSEYFLLSSQKLNAGMTASFLISSDKRIVVKSDSVSKMLYGYFMDFKEKVSFEKAQIKILSADNSVLTYPIADRVTVNNGTPTDSDNLKSLFIRTDTGTPKYQVIKYSINAEGELKSVDTLADAPADGTIVTGAEDGNSLTRYADKEAFLYMSSNAMILPHGRIGSNTVVFSVPSELANEGKVGYVYDRYNDECFLSVGASRLKSKYIGSIDVYDYNENRVPSVIVVYDVSGGAVSKKVRPNVDDVSYMVDEVTKVIDQEGNETIRIYICSLNSYESYLVNYQIYEEIKTEQSIPAKGDIIRFSLNEKNEIIGIANDVVLSADKKSHTINYVDAAGDDDLNQSIQYRLSYVRGKVKSFGDGLLTLDFMGTIPTVGNNIDVSSGFMPFGSSVKKVILYSGDKNPVRVINASDIKSETTHGQGDIIIGRTTYYSINSVFVYRTETEVSR